MNIEELVDDFVTFYVAGQETTSSLLSFALIFTLQNPHVLERYGYTCTVHMECTAGLIICRVALWCSGLGNSFHTSVPSEL